MSKVAAEAGPVKPSNALERHLGAVRAAAKRCKLANPRIFGSVARGTDTGRSDLDMLVDPLPETTLFDVGAFQDEIQELLGVRVEVHTPGDLPAPIRERVSSEARPL